MPIKMPDSDPMGMNMTPMIDIVFNLVQFFMLTLDLSHKELAVLDLPRATQGVVDKDPGADPKAKAEDKLRFIINLEPGNSIYFKGRRWQLTSSDPKEQDTALNNLRQELIAAHRNAPPGLKVRDPDGTSRLMVLIRGDRTAKWKYVQWVMQVCADPAVKIYKIHFAIEHKKE